jgi:hypothetical protein
VRLQRSSARHTLPPPPSVAARWAAAGGDARTARRAQLPEALSPARTWAAATRRSSRATRRSAAPRPCAVPSASSSSQTADGGWSSELVEIVLNMHAGAPQKADPAGSRATPLGAWLHAKLAGAIDGWPAEQAARAAAAGLRWPDSLRQSMHNAAQFYRPLPLTCTRGQRRRRRGDVVGARCRR